MTDDLDPITPREAVNRWLDRRREDSATATVESYSYRLDQFIQWCEQERSDTLLNLNQLDGRDLQRYWEYRSEDLNKTSLKNDFGTLKKFLEWAVAIEAVEPDLPDKADVMKPHLSKKERVNDVRISTERAQQILDYIGRFRYASRDHVLLLLMWRTAARISGLRALDLDDVQPDDGMLEFVHRPQQGTPLKNQDYSERLIALTDPTVQVLEDYIRQQRAQTVDEYGRQPLLSTRRGRMAESTIRKTTYQLTHPCLSGPCPHDEDPDTCLYREHGHESRCPSAVSPHKIRTGSISWMRERGIPADVVAERVDATPETIRDHYDRADPRERLEQRRNHFEELQ